MADSILSLEEICERMLTIFRINWETEKSKSGASAKAPLLVDEHFMFGNPAILPQSGAVTVYPEDQDGIDTEGGITTAGPCCVIEEGRIHIKWYCKEHEQARAHRIINQMGEVIKRMLMRNKMLVFLGAGMIHGLKIEPIIYGETVKEAYEGNNVFYPSGEMLVRVYYGEHFDTHLS